MSKPNQFKTSDEDLSWCIERLDDTGGYLVKGDELKWFIQHFVNKDRSERRLFTRLAKWIKRKGANDE